MLPRRKVLAMSTDRAGTIGTPNLAWNIAIDAQVIKTNIRLVFMLGAALHDMFKNPPFGKNQPDANTQNHLMHVQGQMTFMSMQA